MAKFSKQRFVSNNDLGSLRVEMGLEGHKTIDYDRTVMRKALNKAGADVRKEARRLVSRRAISSAGQNPGLVTGDMMRSIGTVSRGSKGGWVKIGPKRTDAMLAKEKNAKWAFYPAFLFYGSPKRNIAKRANFMGEALANRRDVIRSQVRSALSNALVPR